MMLKFSISKASNGSYTMLCDAKTRTKAAGGLKDMYDVAGFLINCLEFPLQPKREIHDKKNSKAKAKRNKKKNPSKKDN